MALILLNNCIFAIQLGKIPTAFILDGENGETVSGKPWNSKMLKNKIHVLFYISPDKKDENESFFKKLSFKAYNKNLYASIAIVNLKGTWLPNFAIEKMMEKQQEKYPETLYIKDKNKYLIKKWELSDNSSNIIIFNKIGKIIYLNKGITNRSFK